MGAIRDVESILEVIEQGEGAVRRATELLSWGKRAVEQGTAEKEKVESGGFSLAESAEWARTFLASIPEDDYRGTIDEPTEPLKPVRKTRADAGKARGPRVKSNEGRMQAGELPEDAVRSSAQHAARAIDPAMEGS